MNMMQIPLLVTLRHLKEPPLKNMNRRHFFQVCRMLLVLLFAGSLITAHGSYQEDDWIDPTDMLNYDAASGTMRKRHQDTVEEAEIKESVTDAVYTACLAQRDESRRRVESLKQELEVYSKKEELKSPQSNSNPIFKRHLHKILNEVGRLGLPDESQAEAHYDAEVLLTKQMLAEIQKFLDDDDWNPGALDEALSKTLVHFKEHDAEAWRWRFEDYFGVDPYTAFMVLLCPLCIISMVATELWTHVAWFTQIKRFFVLSIIVSFGWNWLYLYKVAWAESQADVARMGTFDSSCSDKINWFEGMMGWMKSSVTFQNDPCKEYYKSVMVHPALMVPPTKALALTFTNFITEPLKHVGKGMGEFLKGFLSEIPVLLQIPVLILMALAALGFCYGTGRSVGQFSNIRHLPSPERDRPVPVEQQRPDHGRFIEDGNHQRYRGRDPNQLEWPKRDREGGQRVVERVPENLRAGDITDNRKEAFITWAPIAAPDPVCDEREEPGREQSQPRKKEQIPEKESRKSSGNNHTRERPAGPTQQQPPRPEKTPVREVVETLTSNFAAPSLPCEEKDSGSEPWRPTMDHVSDKESEEALECNSEVDQSRASPISPAPPSPAESAPDVETLTSTDPGHATAAAATQGLTKETNAPLITYNDFFYVQ
ncbi:chloride channel CLIC-like protein 1 isoform X2 [Ascaphus truei]|uniref:chloride channel CLIC-like protein 1 isoform X2 n=1 Tax=Ascaphus truei TaxID=8439 RepID=UPI003F5A8F49